MGKKKVLHGSIIDSYLIFLSSFIMVKSKRRVFDNTFTIEFLIRFNPISRIGKFFCNGFTVIINDSSFNIIKPAI